MKIISAGSGCADGCAWGGVEFNMLFGSTASGFRFCCDTQTSNQPVFRSDNQVAIIRAYARLIGAQNFNVQYRAVSASNTTTTTTSKSIQPCQRTMSS